MPVAYKYSARTKSQADLLQDWLKEVPFQCFVTVRPINAISMDTLKKVIHDFQRACEMTFRSPLSYVISYETKPCLNVHMLIAASRQLDIDWMQSYLKFKANTMDCQVLPYEPHKDGISYVLKCSDRDNGSNWEMSDFMFLYLPVQKDETSRQKLLRKLHNRRLGV